VAIYGIIEDALTAPDMYSVGPVPEPTGVVIVSQQSMAVTTVAIKKQTAWTATIVPFFFLAGAVIMI
jgi:hypothetical protein